MDDTYKKQRKTNRVLLQKKQERERRIQEVKHANMSRLNKQMQEFEKDQTQLKSVGDEKSKRSVKFYEKLFEGNQELDAPKDKTQRFQRFPENDNREEKNEQQQENKPEKIYLPREEFLKMKKEKDFKMNQKRKFKSLYGRKTTKGQPIMKYRINHLLSKIKSGIPKKS